MNMPTHQQEMLKTHIESARELIDEVNTQFEAQRQELFAAQKRAEAAEQSRDIVRKHAQAALEDYRANKAAKDNRINELETALQYFLNILGKGPEYDELGLQVALRNSRNLLVQQEGAQQR